MIVNFQQGIVSHQEGGFLQVNGAVVGILADNRPTTVTVAHRLTNYTHSEDLSLPSAWLGPFTETNYWLYWDFSPLDFTRTFGKTDLEPVAQSIPPGSGNTDIFDVVDGDAGIGQFIVNGKFVLPASKPFVVLNSTGNNGTYTVVGAAYNTSTGRTTITVNEAVPDPTADGEVTLDIDSSGNPLFVDGRHWFDTSTNKHYVLNGSLWREVIRVFAAQLINGVTLISFSQNAGSGDFTGTQVGSNIQVPSGRVLFGEAGNPIRRDEGTFFTTEDQFFTNQSRVDALRLESNVTRAQSIEGTTISQFSVVAWTNDGQVTSAQYDDTGTTVLGLLTETIQHLEVGAIITQGSVTNPGWNWTGGIDPVPVGSPLWVSNGQLVTTNPNLAAPIQYPVPRVPVARVLDKDTIIFEQGLGGVGPQGPIGSIEDFPVANTTDVGGVTLLTPSSNELRGFVISDTDFRLTNARQPLSHSHQASDVAFIPGAGIISSDVQNGMLELGVGKLDLIGGTMTGPLTLDDTPTVPLHAANKQYVDNLVSGLIWLEPVDLIDMVSDVVATPPGSPELGEAYIMPASPTGAWSAIPQGNIAHWNGTSWDDLGTIGVFDNAPRFGIAFFVSATPSGSFAGRKNDIAVYAAATLTGFVTPVNNNAVFVHTSLSVNAFKQYAFNGTSWVLFSSGQNLTADGTTIEFNTNVISAIPHSAGGTIDAELWQGLQPSDLVSVYAPIVHTHTIPYDFAFFITGPIQPSILVGSFMVTRPISVKSPAGESIAYAQDASSSSYTFDIVHEIPTVSSTIVGTIAFSAGVNYGVITWGFDTSFSAGDLLQIATPIGAPDSTLGEITITIVGCALASTCSL